MNEAIHAGTGGVRAMYYSHDTYGLGHLRRTLTLARHLGATVPGLSQLIVTGSQAANRFSLPPGVDCVKLPSVTKNPAGTYVPSALPGDIDEIVGIRSALLLAAADSYQPDFFIVDHAPAGLMGEAVATLRHLKQAFPRTKLVVGLRDIMDDAPVVRRAWSRDGSYELFDDLYDLIMVYGDHACYDVVTEYGFSSRAAAKTRFVGYLGRPPSPCSPQEVRASMNLRTDRLVVVTGGGGGDGAALYEAMLGDLRHERDADFDCLIVGGPMLADSERSALRARLGDTVNVQFLDFADDLPAYLGAADAVVSMGGYNSICEILSLRRPALIVPRTRPRKEQLIRATVLSGRGFVDMLHPRDLAPGRLLDRTRRLLAGSASERPAMPMTGLGNVADAIGSMLGGGTHAVPGRS